MMSQQLPLSPTSGSDASLDEIESLHVPPQPVKHDQRLEWTLVSRRSSEPMMSTTTHLATRHAPIHQSNATIVTQPGLRSSTESSEAEHYDSESSLSSTTSGPAVFLSAGLDTQRFSAKTQPPSQMDAHADRLTLPQDRAFDFTPSAYLTAPSSPILPASTPLDSSTATLPSLSPKRTRKNPTPQRSLPSASTETMRHQYGYSTEEDTSSVPFMWSPRVVKLAYFSPPPKMRRRKLGVRRVSPPQKSKSPTPTPFTLDSSGVGAASRRSTSRSSPAAPAAKRTRISSPEESGQEIRPPPAPKKRSAAKPMPTGEGLDQAASSITWKGRPLDISDSPSLHLLIPEEEHMCIVLRVTPEQYLMVKEVMLEKYAERGPFTKSQLRKWVRMDVTKLGKMYDFVAAMGWMTASSGLPGKD